MLIRPCALSGVYEITGTPHHDHRGYFTRLYDRQLWSDYGLDRIWVQENRSYSSRKGTIRGLHFQRPPHGETKVVRVSRGAILDVFVDMRRDSPTFGQWGSIELTEDNHKMIYIPRGFAHGFCTLTDHCEVTYKVDHRYTPSHEGGIVWNDETLRIDWPVSAPILSDRDARLPAWKELMGTSANDETKGRSG
ncbi:dTDP-4-dehydrorhamnose 3,5-epimerase [Paenibacillus sp. GCM10012303]|uniref:dTDP-4-dehydrorhamnose 3,5-epimerase n=1 Tax=Paenibacillus sp. GCM10012303 TaxID=3317340 RepID=UPI00360BAB7F